MRSLTPFSLFSGWVVLLVALAPTAHAWNPLLLHYFYQKYYAQRNFDTISHIYNSTVYPHQIPIILGGAAAVPDGLFSHKVRGRVYPVGNFTSFEDSIEYFFALSPLPEGNAVKAAITGYKITEFTSGCKDVASSVVYLYTSVVNPGCPDHGKALPPLKQIAYWKFDEDGTVLKYDAWIPGLNPWVEATVASRITNASFQKSSIAQICGATQLRCSGANQQWDSVEQCIEGLSAKDYGNYGEAWGDNVVCRTIHLVLTLTRPDIHCKHVGPNGGGKCVDIGDMAYLEDETLYEEPLGETFVCKK
ncbi:hypothetical protein F5X68DRAFT_158936 [Plectosphaerella plurivora]|uniref:Uncharacterized protein n=1 Tax=Plectosphaerella plurivora TaxID=936078 RepID=A0A9P9A7G4_9PEZI|nr:hypothetical protein F5X68DRAFT_158936 [Plectosphaerella plurivora]